jgi:hypothetical protein
MPLNVQLHLLVLQPFGEARHQFVHPAFRAIGSLAPAPFALAAGGEIDHLVAPGAP